jgi:hypothetical protein
VEVEERIRSSSATWPHAFVPGATIRASGRAHEGPLTIRVGTKSHIIGPPLAARIYVSAA